MKGKFRKFRPGYREEVRQVFAPDGSPALWEWGGGSIINTGHAVIIASSDGSPKKAAVIALDRHPNSNHALIPVAPGDYVIQGMQWRLAGQEARVWKIEKIENGIIFLVLEFYLYEEEWDPTPPDGMLAQAVQAALGKASCRECREPHWIAQQ